MLSTAHNTRPGGNKGGEGREGCEGGEGFISRVEYIRVLMAQVESMTTPKVANTLLRNQRISSKRPRVMGAAVMYEVKEHSSC